MIDHQGISTGEEVRRLMDVLETNLIINLKNHLKSNTQDIIKWQQEKRAAFFDFQKSNQSIIKSFAKPLQEAIMTDLKESYNFGINYVEKQLEKASKKGKTFEKVATVSSFSKNRRVQAQLKQIQESLNRIFVNASKDLEKQYLTVIANTNRYQDMPLEQTIDLINKQFLMSGVSAGTTSDGRNMNIVSKLEIDTKEWSQEIMFMGEAEKASEVGNYYVYITIHASSCPLCTPWQNKVLIDDVYQDGKPDGKHELLSVAIQKGLFHYNCRHNRLTFIPGVDEIPEKPSWIPNRTSEQHELYQKEQMQRYMERQIRAWKRREVGALSEVEYRKARLKVRQWQSRRTQLVHSTDGLYRAQYWREKPGFRLARDTRWQDLRYNKNLI